MSTHEALHILEFIVERHPEYNSGSDAVHRIKAALNERWWHTYDAAMTCNASLSAQPRIVDQVHERCEAAANRAHGKADT